MDVKMHVNMHAKMFVKCMYKCMYMCASARIEVSGVWKLFVGAFQKRWNWYCVRRAANSHGEWALHCPCLSGNYRCVTCVPLTVAQGASTAPPSTVNQIRRDGKINDGDTIRPSEVLRSVTQSVRRWCNVGKNAWFNGDTASARKCPPEGPLHQWGTGHQYHHSQREERTIVKRYQPCSCNNSARSDLNINYPTPWVVCGNPANTQQGGKGRDEIKLWAEPQKRQQGKTWTRWVHDLPDHGNGTARKRHRAVLWPAHTHLKTYLCTLYCTVL